MTTINCKKYTYKGLIQGSEIVVLLVDNEEKMYTLEGIVSLAKINQENLSNLSELNKARCALMGESNLQGDQPDLFNSNNLK